MPGGQRHGHKQRTQGFWFLLRQVFLGCSVEFEVSSALSVTKIGRVSASAIELCMTSSAAINTMPVTGRIDVASGAQMENCRLSDGG